MQGVTLWTSDEDDLVKKHWKKDLNARAIGALMGKTRMAVIGRAHRLGLGDPRSTENTRQRIINRAEKAVNQVAKARNRFKRSSAPSIPTINVQTSNVEILNGVGVKVWELNSKHCRFIPDNPASLTYCGHPIHSGSSYCEGHLNFVTRKKS